VAGPSQGCNLFRASFVVDNFNAETRIEIIDNDFIPQVFDALMQIDGVKSITYIVYSEEFCSVITNDCDGAYIVRPQDIGLSADYVLEFQTEHFPSAYELSLNKSDLR
jgi:hypothetical protein